MRPFTALAATSRCALFAACAAALIGQGPPPGFTHQSMAQGLDNATAMAFAPDGRLFITERVTGRIRVFKDGVLQAAPWATVAVWGQPTWGEQGLLGIAVDPDFLNNGFVYVYYTETTGAQNVIARLQDLNGVGTGQTVLTPPNAIPSAWYHNGGPMVFGTDGTLFVATGDGWNNPSAAQDLSVWHGKVLRFEVPNLTIPASNPIPGSAIWSYGHRNQFGIAINPLNGALYQTENGTALADELNLIGPGGNYGWPRVEGNETVPDPGLVDPLLTFQPTIAPTGCCFYSGSNYPASYRYQWFVSDYNNNKVRAVTLDAAGKAVVAHTVFHGQAGGGYGVVMGPDGNIWQLMNDFGGYGANRLARYVYASEPNPAVNIMAVSNHWVGGAATVSVHGQNGGFGLAWMSTQRFAAPLVTPWGDGWVMPDAVLPLITISVDDRGYCGIPLPKDPSLLDLQVHVQGAALQPSGALVLTNATDCVLRG